MPFSENITELINREILVEPEYGYGWILVGRTPEPAQIDVPAAFNGLVSDVLCDAGTRHALVAQCEANIAGHTFRWIGIIPRTDSTINLAAVAIYCKVILTLTPPYLTRQDACPESVYLLSESKIYVRGSARVEVVPKR